MNALKAHASAESPTPLESSTRAAARQERAGCMENRRAEYRGQVLNQIPSRKLPWHSPMTMTGLRITSIVKGNRRPRHLRERERDSVRHEPADEELLKLRDTG